MNAIFLQRLSVWKEYRKPTGGQDGDCRHPSSKSHKALYAIAVGTVVAISGCTSVRPIMAPSGAQGYMVWCEIPSQCYTKAASICPKGYVVEADPKDYWGLGDVDGNLLIVCR